MTDDKRIKEEDRMQCTCGRDATRACTHINTSFFQKEYHEKLQISSIKGGAKMNLYWVNNAIYKLYDEFVDPDTGEISDPDEFAARYAALDISREEIIENTLLMYKNCIADAAAIADEIKVLKERKDALERKAERFKTDAADALGGEKFQTAKVAVAWRKSTIATSDDESIAPDEYMKVTVTQKPDKNAIKAAIKSGTEVSGWRLAENMNMTVR